MKNSEIWQSYADYTKTVSENLRRFAFAAIGICWVIKDSDSNISALLLTSIIFIFIYFILDTAQSVIGAVKRKNWIENKEKEYLEKNKSIKGEYYFPKKLDSITFKLWQLKILVVGIAYLFIAIKFIKIIF